MIFDPSWNPAQDLQAQDRSFRYGQKRHVTVFRLLAAGSLEELVYTRQIYKQQLSNIAVSGKMEKRYFEGVQVYIFIKDNQHLSTSSFLVIPYGNHTLCLMSLKRTIVLSVDLLTRAELVQILVWLGTTIISSLPVW